MAFFCKCRQKQTFLQIASKLLSSSYRQRKKDESHRLFYSTSGVFIMGELLIRMLLMVSAWCHFTANSFGCHAFCCKMKIPCGGQQKVYVWFSDIAGKKCVAEKTCENFCNGPSYWELAGQCDLLFSQWFTEELSGSWC